MFQVSKKVCLVVVQDLKNNKNWCQKHKILQKNLAKDRNFR